MPTVTKKEKKGLSEEIKLPEGAQAEIKDNIVCVKGAKGDAKKNLVSVGVTIEVKDSMIIVSSKKSSKRERKIVKSFTSHIKNLVKGAEKGYVYKLKICAGHFPMTVTVSGKEIVIKNYLGEKTPRKHTIPEGASVKVEGSEIVIEGVDKEIVSQCAASIEQVSKRSNYDRRIFQDGIFIIKKDEKEIA